jgi:hypothetical protein
VRAPGLAAGARRLRWRDLELDRHLRCTRVHGSGWGRCLVGGLSYLGDRTDERDLQLFDGKLHRDDRGYDDIVGRLDGDDRGHDDIVGRLDRHRDPAQRWHRHRSGHRDRHQRWGQSWLRLLSAEPRGVLTHPVRVAALGSNPSLSGRDGGARQFSPAQRLSHDPVAGDLRSGRLGWKGLANTGLQASADGRDVE